ncbi:family 10 glycosylhydrolase, partial [Candidatus Sumerlaeota bacterium]|nr:family 10 glycosylhydrolase [Candidatus Sumerlaeota bacterium]
MILIFIFILFFSAFPHWLQAQVVIADAVKLVHVDYPTTCVAIVDESEPGFSFSGDWVVGTVPGGYLNTYIYAVASDSYRKAGYWAMDIPADGTYEVTAWYIPGSNRLPNVLYKILHNGGVSEAEVNQTTGGNWTSLGSFDFSERCYIRISNRLTVDTVEDFIIDDGEILFSATGYWPTGTQEAGFRGDYLFHGCSIVASATARWDAPVFIGGNYEVYAWVYPGSNRCSAAHYLIPYAGGFRDIKINQSIGEEGWRYLGVYPYTAGNYPVELNNAGSTDKVVIADALMFRYSSIQGSLPPSIDLVPGALTPSSGEELQVKAEAWSVSPGLVVKGERWIDDEIRVWVDLYDDGLHNDDAAGDGIYGGALPGAPSATVIKYRVHATNDTGMTSLTDEMRCLVAYDEATTPELRWIFGGPFNTPEWADSTLEIIRSSNLNAQCVKVTSDVYCYYKSSYQPMFPSVPEGYDPLAGLIERAHDTSEGKSSIQIHAFIVFYVALTTDTPPPGHILDIHPEWTDENYDGEQVITTSVNTRMYLDAGAPEVQDYYVDRVMEIVNSYDIDGFNMDHIRYRQQNMGYNPIALSWFHHFTGRSDRPAIDDPEWSDWRREQITNLTKRIFANIRKVKPHILVTMDGVASGGVYENMEDNVFWGKVFQDYPGWLSNHHMDAVLGMAYREEANPALAQEFSEWQSFLRDVRGDREATAIVAAYKNRIQDTLVQLHKVRRSGSPILSIYSFSEISNENESEESFFTALRSQLFP